MKRLFRGSQLLRPLALFAACVVLLAIADGSHGRVLSLATANSMLQTFATIGPVALGLGMTMLVREFDLSVAGLFGLAGCIAVLTGSTSPLLGIAAALAAKPGTVANEIAQGRADLDSAGLAVEYLEIREADTLAPITATVTPPSRIFAAVHLGRTRLIDNLPITREA